jgi:zinc protease
VSDLGVLDRRPGPGAPRQYDFPDFERSRLGNGLTILCAHVPGRPLLQAQLVVHADAGGGAAREDPRSAGVTLLTARALSEGTERRDAGAFVEAAERLGASLAAAASWDDLSVRVEVPRGRLREAMALQAEMALRPSFPDREVERLRDERLNDLKQTMADPRRRANHLFPAVIYADDAAYARPAGGSEETVAGLDRTALVERHAQLMRPEASTLIVSGDLDGVDVADIAAASFEDWTAFKPPLDGLGGQPDAAREGRRIVVVDRPGAPQSELRIGHVGTSRHVDDYHALSVMNALLGGLFNSRLNRLLREERGYTYGVNSGFQMRRAAGPFLVRCAVESEATAPAIADIMAEVERIRETEVESAELAAARDYLVGVFPLRFETSAQVAEALAGLVIHDLPDDELDRYRPTVAAVSAEAVLTAARRHLRPAETSIAVVGDVDRFRADLAAAGYGELEVIEDEGFRAAAGS